MSTAIDPTPLPGGASARTVYASFLLGTEEFALDVRHVQEVVKRPTQMVAMPLAPDFCLGIFNLRGIIIPLLSTDRLLGLPPRPLAPEAKVVIIHHLGIRLGLSCDDTCHVLRPRGEELTLFSYQDQSVYRVVAGVLKLNNALVRVLDLERLIRLENIPHPENTASTHAAAKARLARRKAITFRAGGIAMAFPIGSIHEIVRAQGIEASPVQDPLCEGVLHIRQHIVPVVQFAGLLGLPPTAAATENPEQVPEQRVVVLKIAHGYIGLLVDSVDSIDVYTDDEVMAVPVLSRQRAAMFAGCIDLGARGHVFLLNAQGVFALDEIDRITGQHSALFVETESVQVRQHRAASRMSFLWFKAGTAFALPMREVREIVHCPSDLIPIPGAPQHISGMFNLRGQLVTVVDVRYFYQLGGAVLLPSAEDKILVIDYGDALIGLRVDSVESILHIYPEDKFPMPQVLRGALAPAIRNDVREVVRVPDSGERPVHLLVLDLARVLAQVAATAEGEALEPA
ncbi:MAG: chemotaxis protein CheW [Giesbergeria sp.]|uniref:chemotaxis protein CheW n=1 Tax=Giesbergeria sp. TaxID=2818473 RepID=UPI00261A2A5E|nr:chemotaxis protein CheW [Giesbergeria sp.]MDD2609780.1 chemotaxis protein CheW [Giesbergeria sp.]